MNPTFTNIFNSVASQLFTVFGEEANYYRTGEELINTTVIIREIPKTVTEYGEVLEYGIHTRLIKHEVSTPKPGDVIEMVVSGNRYVIIAIDAITTNEVVSGVWLKPLS